MATGDDFIAIRRSALHATLAWAAGLVMLATATSVVGLFVAPVAVPASAYVVTRRGTSWTVRVPLLLGGLALLLLAVAYLASGAGTGTKISPRQVG